MGENHTFYCSGAKDATWKFSNKIPNNVIIFQGESYSKIEIINAGPENEGEYSCNWQDESGKLLKETGYVQIILGDREVF